MDRRTQELVLARCHTVLRDNLNIQSIFPHLTAKRLLTSGERNYLLNDYHSPQDKIDRVVQWIPRKGRDALIRFIECLEASSDDARGHKELTELLEKCGIEETAPFIMDPQPRSSSELYSDKGPNAPEAFNAQ